MKKILCAFICILLLGGCSDGKAKENQNEPLDFGGFECVVRAETNGIGIAAKTVYTPYENIALAFLEPEAAKGTEISCKAGEYTVTAHGMTLTLTAGKAPFAMVCRQLEECLNSVRGVMPQTDGESGECFYTYSGSAAEYRLYTDSETGVFKRLTAGGETLLTFENFTFT